MLKLILSGLLLSLSVAQAASEDLSYYAQGFRHPEHSARLHFNKGPKKYQQGILRLQRTGAQFTLFRCVAQGLSAANIDDSECQKVGVTDLEKLNAVAEKFGAGQPLLPEEKHMLWILFTNSAVLKFGVLGAVLSGFNMRSYILRAGISAFRRGFFVGAASLGVATLTVYAGYLAWYGYERTREDRLDAQSALQSLGRVLQGKIPDGQEFVQPLPADLWGYFDPSYFR